jgi:hypothetical protein
MGHLLSSDIGNAMKRYLGEVGRDRGIKEVSTMKEISASMFFNWDVDQNYAIECMSGAAHCEVYEAFQAVKKFGVGMTYNKKVNLVIFAGKDIPIPPGEERKFIFEEGQNKLNELWKKLTEFNRMKYKEKVKENSYRGAVYRALEDQPLSNFMLANHKAPFNNSLFRFTVKARNQALMTHS